MTARSDPPVVGRTSRVTLPLATIDGWWHSCGPRLTELRVTGQEPLTGGVSGAGVDRIWIEGRSGTSIRRCDVVLKRSEPVEVAVLQRLAAMQEASIPELIAYGLDEAGVWIVLPYFPGPVAGLTAEPPAEVFQTMARIHAHFLAVPDALPTEVERIDEGFCVRCLTEFAPDVIGRARGGAVDDMLLDRAADVAHRFAGDADLVGGTSLFPSTLLHGDLYGLNVLLPGPGQPHAMIIDWNAARVGPAMFDVALAGAHRGPGHRAYLAAAALPEQEAELGFAWASALINATYAGVLARRGTRADVVRMLDVAESALLRFHRLLS